MDRFSANTALMVIDVQVGFDHLSWGRRNNLLAEHNIATLLAAWREAALSLVHVRHLSLQSRSVFAANTPGNAIKAIVAPLEDELVITKHVNSAFIGTALEETLRERKIDTLVIVGLTTDHCVSTTVRMAANLGFDTYCVSDATATFERVGPNGKHYTALEIHDVTLASLNGEFATILDVATVLDALPQPTTLSGRNPS